MAGSIEIEHPGAAFLPAMTRFTSLLLYGLVACASQPPPTASIPVTYETAAPPVLPNHLPRAELERRVAAGDLVAMDLKALSHKEVSMGDQPSIERPGELALSNAMPGGWSTVVYADRFRRLWIATWRNEVHVPDNVSISATRVFETRFEIPIGYRVAGRFDVDEATQTPR